MSCQTIGGVARRGAHTMTRLRLVREGIGCDENGENEARVKKGENRLLSPTGQIAMSGTGQDQARKVGISGGRAGPIQAG